MSSNNEVNSPLVQMKKPFEKNVSHEYCSIDGESEEHQEEYSRHLSNFSNSMKMIEVKNIQQIHSRHWILNLLDDNRLKLESLSFEKCSFKNIDDFLTRHKNLSHLAFRGGFCESNGCIRLPEYRNLKSLELSNFRHIWKPSLEQIFQNNPQLESLSLRSCGGYFSLEEIVELVCNHLKCLKVFNILDCYDSGVFISDTQMDKLTTLLEKLESFGITVSYGVLEVVSKLLTHLGGTKCEKIKHLELSGRFDTEMIERVCAFDNVETLSFIDCWEQDQLESIIERLPQLRSLSVSFIIHRTNADILSIVRKCKKLETLTIESEQSDRYQDEDENGVLNGCKINAQLHYDFVHTMPNPNTTIVFKEMGESFALVTKEEIIWRQKLIHWTGYDPKLNRSDLKLLDLATVPKGSNVKHKQPLNLIFNYLDLSSLYAVSRASKQSKQLVDRYIYQRCKQHSNRSSKKYSKQPGKIVITDEFGIDFRALRTYKNCMLNLEIICLNWNHSLHSFIGKYCKNLTKRCIRTRDVIQPQYCICPQVRHFIFYGYVHDYYSENCVYNCDLNELARLCPNLEILELKTPAKLSAGNAKHPNAFRNLRKILYKPNDYSQVKFAKEFFKASGTEVIVDG